MGDVLEPLSKRELISLIDLEVDRVKERDAEIARLTEENRALVAYIELIDPKRDWTTEQIEKMRSDPEVREGRLVIQPILARHREEASRGITS